MQDYATLTRWCWTKWSGEGNIFALAFEECKIPAWAMDKIFWHKQGVFSFPELQISRGELHFD
jgi:hypothetical protein